MEDHDTHWSFIAFAMKFTHDTDNVSKIGRAILTFIGEKDAAHKKKKEEQICMIGRQLTNIAEGKWNLSCMKGSDYRAFVLKGSKDSGFEIVHPSHSKMEQEEDITGEEYQVPSEEKTATKQPDLKNEEQEDKMSE